MRTPHSPLAGLVATFVAIGLVLVSPVARAQEVQQQGADQGTGQGEGQGGPSAADLGIGNPEVDQSTIVDSRVGATQGAEQGTDAWRAAESGEGSSVAASNEQTGADSTNTSSADVTQSAATDVTNTSETANSVDASAVTGENSASENTGSASLTTGDASIGVQAVTADNLNTGGSYGEISHGASAGSQTGDLVLDFSPGMEGGPLDESFRSTNTVTGSGSDNTAAVTSERETVTEIQNDGAIANTVAASAVSGENEAAQNTGDASVATGDANVAATVINFLNAAVVDGALWLEVADIFGDLTGNIVIPEEAVAYLTRRQRELLVDATNQQTGADSTNTVEVDVTHTEETEIANTATVDNAVDIAAITGQNTATQNTGGATIDTGDVQATTNTVTLANLNVVDGNLGLIIVNALNRWLGFLLGSDGSWTPIGHEYTTIEAGNSATGADSTNTAAIDVETTEETTVTNTASVANDLDLEAVTGKNTVMQNTGNAAIRTGDARVHATVVNVVNTTVVRGGFFAVVVNIFGNWVGDLFFGGQPSSALAASLPAAGSSGTGGGVDIEAENTETGAGSVNTIDVDATNELSLEVSNAATIVNSLTVDADTGHNEANRNTGLADIRTGDALAALHARNVANVTLASLAGPWANITADLLNATTGTGSTNTIDVTVNDEREVTVLNDATVDTAIGAVANTGFNTASRNTLGGCITTGLANLVARLENLLNQTWLTGYGGGLDLTLTNAADIANAVSAASDSGGNEADRNTGTRAFPASGAAVLACGVPASTAGSVPVGEGIQPPVNSAPPASSSGGGPSGDGANSGSGGDDERPTVAEKKPKRKARRATARRAPRIAGQHHASSSRSGVSAVRGYQRAARHRWTPGVRRVLRVSNVHAAAAAPEPPPTSSPPVAETSRLARWVGAARPAVPFVLGAPQRMWSFLVGRLTGVD